MAKDNSRFSPVHQGFLTMWALLFLMTMSTVLAIVLAGQAAQLQTTTQFIRQYDQQLLEHKPAISGGPGVHKTH